MKYEIFVVWETDETDERGEIIYKNPNLNFKGNRWDARKYADKHHFGAGVQVYDIEKKKYRRIV